MTRVSVVIPTHSRAETLRATLEALVAVDLSRDEFEVLVVDDAGDPATASTVEALQRRHLPVRYLRNDGRGAAAARNAGARAAAGTLLLFLDDDMIVGPHHLCAHLQTHVRHPRVMVGGDRWYTARALAALEETPFGRYRIELERGYAAARGEAGPGVAGVVEVSTLPSFDLSVASDEFWRIGGFDESFPYAGAEDQDLSTRARRLGLRLVRDHDIRLLHEDGTGTLRQFARREEQGAHTVLALVRKFPEYLGDFHRNEPIGRGDPVTLVLSKSVKTILSRRAALEALHRLVESLERRHAPDRLLRPLYRAVLGLHIFRGYREAMNGPAPFRRGHPRPVAPVNDVATVIVTHNAEATLRACIESVRAWDDGVANEIVVVDAGSDDSSAAIAGELGATVLSTTNVGYGAGNNLGWREAAPARYLFVLNPDARIVGGGLRAMVDAADRDADIGVMAPMIVDGRGEATGSLAAFTTPLQDLRDRIHGVSLAAAFTPVERASSFDWALGCALLFRGSCFESVGGFDERFFLYYEEEDIQRATRAAGWLHRAHPEMLVEHGEEQRSMDARVFAQIFRAKLYCAAKWSGPGAVLAYRFGLSLDLIRRLVLGQPGDWAPAYRAALRVLLRERVHRSPRRARDEQIRRTIG